MKKIIILFILFLMLIVSFSCTNNDCIIISYDVDGGKILHKQFLYEDTKYVHLTPIKEGHRFIGWYSDPSFDSRYKVNYDYNFIKDITLYAKWEIITYIVKVQYFDLEKKYFVEYANELELEVLTYKERLFKYFYYHEVLIKNNKIIVTQDMTISASFEELN